MAAARTSAATILSYDYRHLDADFAAASALTTGSFRTDYQATTAKAVRQLATQTKAVVSAKVAAAGVVSSSADRATVLLFVNQTTTSNRLDSAKVDQVRVQMMHDQGRRPLAGQRAQGPVSGRADESRPDGAGWCGGCLMVQRRAATTGASRSTSSGPARSGSATNTVLTPSPDSSR